MSSRQKQQQQEEQQRGEQQKKSLSRSDQRKAKVKCVKLAFFLDVAMLLFIPLLLFWLFYVPQQLSRILIYLLRAAWGRGLGGCLVGIRALTFSSSIAMFDSCHWNFA